MLSPQRSKPCFESYLNLVRYEVFYYGTFFVMQSGRDVKRYFKNYSIISFVNAYWPVESFIVGFYGF
jgi:hypothetical protein